MSYGVDLLVVLVVLLSRDFMALFPGRPLDLVCSPLAPSTSSGCSLETWWPCVRAPVDVFVAPVLSGVDNVRGDTGRNEYISPLTKCSPIEIYRGKILDIGRGCDIMCYAQGIRHYAIP